MKEINYAEIEAKLGYRFVNKKLLMEALTHKSSKQSYNNERLEFLGDAVLDLVVGEFLYKKFPVADEGELSKIRASLVNEKGFATLGAELDIGKYINISQAEEKSRGREKPSILSNAFEALMGAIYLETGLERVAHIVEELLIRVYPKIELKALFSDYKTGLQEITQAKYGVTPLYSLVATSGPDHKKEFEVLISIEGREYAKAKGASKKEAEQAAAKIAMEMEISMADKI